MSQPFGWCSLANVPEPDDQLGFGMTEPRPTPIPPGPAKKLAATIPLGKELLADAEPAELSLPEGDGSVDRINPTTTEALFDSRPDPTAMARSVLDEYIIPPFSVLDSRQGYWQKRKRRWIDGLNIKSEIGRGSRLTYGSFSQNYAEKIRDEWGSLTDEERNAKGHSVLKSHHPLSDTIKDRYGDGSSSVFDPVLCEIVYFWLCPKGGVVLDPFAGGSVRGVVAACLGHPYIGIELSEAQVAANRAQATDILRPSAVVADGVPIPTPLWIAGDSDAVLGNPNDINPEVDLVFSCPPYSNLEIYSDDPVDLSNMSPDEFDEVYSRILFKSMDCLRNDRFAVIVISNIRDRATGRIRDLEHLTCEAMEATGAMFYNEAILLNVCGTAALRAKKQFATSRKLVRTHQRVLIFAKGDPRVATQAIEGAKAFST